MSVCAIGKVDDGTLRVCCSTHEATLCAHHYARTHFVEVAAEWPVEFACNAGSVGVSAQDASSIVRSATTADSSSRSPSEPEEF